MNTATRVLAAALLILCAGGCASSDDQQQQQQQNPNASTIPWNRPQSWESQGMLGGMNQGPQGSTGH
jgi:PBP1b-binding outer membrane lipoprotein LpoB